MAEPILDDSFVREYLVSHLRTRLDRSNMTQSDLAKKLGVSSAYVSQVFSLKTRASLSSLRDVASFLGIADFEFERLVLSAKEAEVNSHRPSDDPDELLRRALLASGLDEIEDIPKILSYIDFQKHERARKPTDS